MSPALAGGFLTTEPPGKPKKCFWIMYHMPITVPSGGDQKGIAKPTWLPFSQTLHVGGEDLYLLKDQHKMVQGKMIIS